MDFAYARSHRLPIMTATVEDLWREMQAPLLRVIARRVSDPRDAEDVLQDVMVRIQRHADQMEEFDRIGAWIQQVTRSAIIDFYRRRAARPEQAAGTGTDVDQFRVSDAVDATSPEALRLELSRCLRPLIARLPDKYREALELTEFDGLTQVEAAECLGLSTSGMKARVQRARRQLRELLLACCHVDLDRRGGITHYESRAGSCGGCDAVQPRAG
jgi:RNA polymerase sigma-70 factor (ECF subfamily)